jgi:hypothetical protein
MRTAILIGLILFTAIPAAAVCEHEEGGYAGIASSDSYGPVYNFLKHFSYDQYYWAYHREFTSQSNSYVDAMDMSIFCGHGAPYMLKALDGWVDLTTAGSTSQKGYNDPAGDCEFFACESCETVPSPKELGDGWCDGWLKPTSIFANDLHMILGYRTPAFVATAPDITDEFGRQVRAGKVIRCAWLDAIEKKGMRGWWPFWDRPLLEFGCVVYRPNCANDTYNSWAAKPSRGLCCWYQY